MTQFLLIAHIGGTKARFGLREQRESSQIELDEFLYKSRYPIGLFQNSTTMIENFIKEARDSLEYRTDKKIDISEITPKNIKVILALAGTVDNNKCDILNWKLSFDGQLLEDKLKFPRVDLINDFQAVAYGIRELINDQEKHYYHFHSLTPKLGSTRQTLKLQKNEIIAVIGIATGLGKSFLIQPSDKGKAYSYATEGGHVNFAPRSQLEFLLFQYILYNIHDDNHCLLKDSYNRVSVERIVSGRGILAIYRFLQDCQNGLDKNTWFQKLPDRFKNEVNKIKEKLQLLKKEVVKNAPETIDQFSEPQVIEQLIKTWQQEDIQSPESVDPAPVITSAAIRKSDPLCIYTMQTFLEITAAVVSNCALHFLPYGGLYLAGGIPPQILPLIEDNKDEFLEAFSQKGCLGSELTKIPISVVNNLEAGLVGIAHYAENNLKEFSPDGEKLVEEISRKRVERINHEVVARELKLSKESKLDIEVMQEPKTESEEKYKASEDLPDPIGVIVVGNELREVFILKTKPDDTRPVSPIPEGCGHGDFAARSLEEFELMEYIQKKENIDRISVEQVVSLKGIVHIYQFLQENYSDSKRSEILQNFKTQISKEPEFTKNIEQIPEVDLETARKIAEADNKAIAIVDAALAERDLLCLKTMAMFSEAYGSEAGNFALRLLPYEGIYLVGVITSKILQDGTWLQKLFLKEFNNKGRMTKIVKNIPLYFIKNEQVD
ncbi:MAG: glucokinase [Xenococcus sp. (in: cyanobacteria)]